jgi:hypothetical protein
MYCVSSLSIVGATDVSAQQCHVHDSAVEEDHVPGNDIIMAMMYRLFSTKQRLVLV